jgi:dolichol kinase
MTKKLHVLAKMIIVMPLKIFKYIQLRERERERERREMLSLHIYFTHITHL